MVEEVVYTSNKPKSRAQIRPYLVYLWSVADVQKWLRRHCSDYYAKYSDVFLQHEISGRALVRFNENTLHRLGITDAEHRQYLLKEILKLRLKTDILEIRDLERKNIYE